MKKKLNCILLVDDNNADNYLHRLVIEEYGCTERIEVRENGEEAIQYLLDTVDTVDFPSMILLDINMPRMNGWEFLRAFEDLPDEARNTYIVFMLTTSMNPDDKNRATDSKTVNHYLNKPLTRDILDRLLRENFSELF